MQAHVEWWWRWLSSASAASTVCIHGILVHISVQRLNKSWEVGPSTYDVQAVHNKQLPTIIQAILLAPESQLTYLLTPGSAQMSE